MTVAIALDKLTKYYGPVKGLNDLNLTVNEGEIFGFLGPNGAGKTTCIRLTLGLIKPDKGNVRLFEKNINRNTHQLMRSIGNLPSDIVWWQGLTGYEILDYFAGFREQLSADLKSDLLDRFMISDELLKRNARTYSRGESRKLGLVVALQHDPDLIILDEPTSGLDPIRRKVFYDYCRTLKAKGRTIFLSSHNLHETQELCDRIGIVRQGMLTALETVESLTAKSIRKVQVNFSTEKDMAEFNVDGMLDLNRSDKKAVFRFSGSINSLMEALSKISIEDFSMSPPSLEDFFIHCLEEDE